MGKTRIQSFFPFLQTLYDTYNLFVKVHNPACYNTLFTQIKKKALASLIDYQQYTKLYMLHIR